MEPDRDAFDSGEPWSGSGFAVQIHSSWFTFIGNESHEHKTALKNDVYSRSTLLITERLISCGVRHLAWHCSNQSEPELPNSYQVSQNYIHFTGSPLLKASRFGVKIFRTSEGLWSWWWVEIEPLWKLYTVLKVRNQSDKYVNSLWHAYIIADWQPSSKRTGM